MAVLLFVVTGRVNSRLLAFGSTFDRLRWGENLLFDVFDKHNTTANVYKMELADKSRQSQERKV